MGLIKLIVRRMILAIPTAIGVVTIIFVALSAMTPTMRLAYFIGSNPRDFRPENVQATIHMYGLDQPILVQYVGWLKKLITLDFGRSLSSGQPAMNAILASLPSTLELLLYSLPFIIVFSIWLGTKAAIHHNRMIDHVARVVGTIGTSFPVFVVAELFIFLSLIVQDPYRVVLDPFLQLTYNVGWELNTRMAAGTFTTYTRMLSIDALLNGDIPLFLDAMMHLILPVAVLVFTQCAALIRVTRSGLIEEVGKPYIVSAMTKGLSRKDVIYKHARKNAAISVLTLSGLLLANMFISLVIVETVFSRPGFAYLVAYASRVQDTPVVFTCATLIAMFYISLNLVVDVLYEYVDPRVKLR